MQIRAIEGLILKHLDPFDADLYLRLFIETMPSDEIDASLLGLLKEKLRDDWIDICKDHHRAILLDSEFAKSYINLINDFVKEGLLTHQDRADLMISPFEEQYKIQNEHAPSLNTLMNIAIAGARLIGYPTADEQDYPLSRIAPLSAKALAQNRAGFLKREMIITQMSVLYFLLHKFCTVEQREILFEVIAYRANTTAEEQRAERGLLSFLIHSPQESKLFFAREEGYINFNPIRERDELRAVEDYIPSTTTALFESICFSESIALFLKVIHRTRHADNLYFQKEAVNFIEAEFYRKPDQSYQASLAFAKELLLETDRLKTRPSVFKNAIYIFCLKHYINIRQGHPQSLFFSFSPQTKIRAANQLIEQINDNSTSLGLREALAVKEGRLGEICSLFTQPEMESLRHQEGQPDSHRF